MNGATISSPTTGKVDATLVSWYIPYSEYETIGIEYRSSEVADGDALTRPLVVRLTDAVWQDLNRVAVHEGRTLADIIRALIREYIQKKEKEYKAETAK